MTELDELLDKYFSIGVKEGDEGRNHDDLDGSAEATRQKIKDCFEGLGKVTASLSAPRTQEAQTENHRNNLSEDGQLVSSGGEQNPAPVSQVVGDVWTWEETYSSTPGVWHRQYDDARPAEMENIRGITLLRPSSQIVVVYERRYKALCDWYLRGAPRSEIHEHGHIEFTTQTHIDAWGRRRAEPTALSSCDGEQSRRLGHQRAEARDHRRARQRDTS